MEKNKKFIVLIVSLLVLILLLLLFLKMFLDYDIIIPLFILVLASLIVGYVMYYNEKSRHSSQQVLEHVLGSSAQNAFNFAKVGFLTYDNKYVITWMSDIFFQYNLDYVGKKLLSWLPELNDLIQGDSDEVVVTIKDHFYLVQRIEAEKIMLFKDITKEYKLEQDYHLEKLVLGIIHFDNYDEQTRYEDEQERSYINNYIKQPVIDWCQRYGIVIKSLKSNRYLLILNERILKELKKDRFSILQETRQASKQIDVAITLSMGFAGGSSDLHELDETCNSLVELAQTRGGDQVCMRHIGEDVQYFGGNSEAKEKRSKVQVRIMANTLKDMIIKANNVIIVGHREMDLDCLAATLIMSNIALAYRKQVCIINKTGGIEESTNNVFNVYKDSLLLKHTFVTENEAINQLKDDSLVVMVDHHDVNISNGFNLLKQAKKIAIFDHHRRKADLIINPSLIYVETGASSTAELLCEFIPYLSKNIDFTKGEANIMYLGILIDTNRFTVRTGSRTFDVVSNLRQKGADPSECELLLSEPYDYFIQKNHILNSAQRYDDNIVVAAVKDNDIYTRTQISQAANALLKLQGINAVFVIARIGEEEVAVSARSTEEFNVQIVMQNMGGGGHLTQAATQRKNENVEDIEKELYDVLNQLKENN